MWYFSFLIIISFLLVPSVSFAWGPLTHVYLGNEIYYFSPLIPTGVYTLIRKYRHDFLYGNLMADIIMWKKYLPDEKSSHSWDVAFNLFESAKTQHQKAFVYGYLSHLAADTVAHERFTGGREKGTHAIFELKADRIIDRKYWFQAMTMDKKVQIRNDVFLEQSLDRFIFSFKTNKRIFKSMVFLSGLNHKRTVNFIDRKSIVPPAYKKDTLERLHRESLERIINLFQNGNKSDVIKKDPLGGLRHNGLLRSFWHIYH